MKAHYDPETDAMHVLLTDPASHPVVESEEVRPGVVLDFDAQGRVVGMEVLRVRQTLPDADPSRLDLEVA